MVLSKHIASPATKHIASPYNLKETKLHANEIIKKIEDEYLKYDLPEIFVGDSIEVGVKIKEGNKERIQPYKGTVIAMRNGGINETITVRRIFQGVGVERIFLLHSPLVSYIKIERRGKVRRAKLYYLRDRVGKATRIKQRFDRKVSDIKITITKLPKFSTRVSSISADSYKKVTHIEMPLLKLK